MAEGETKALREAVREILAARELEIGPAVAEALARESDPETLRHWHRRALRVTSADEILEPG